MDVLAMTTCVMTVQLGSDLVLDDTTATSGIVFGYSSLAGWWDTAPIRAARADMQPDGEIVTAARRMGRDLVLAGSAYAQGGHLPLDLLAYTAYRLLATRTRFVHVPGLLKVNDPGLAAQAYVRRIANVRMKADEDLLAVKFEIPLLAPDPNKYAQTATTDTQLQLTGSGPTDTATVVNAGDANAPLTITIDGPATNPAVTNNTIATTPTLQYTGVLGGADTLVIDTGSATVLLNGVTARANLTTAEWFSLVPGNNSLTYTRTAGTGTSTAQLDYRAAYE